MLPCVAAARAECLHQQTPTLTWIRGGSRLELRRLGRALPGFLAPALDLLARRASRTTACLSTFLRPHILRPSRNICTQDGLVDLHRVDKGNKAHAYRIGPSAFTLTVIIRVPSVWYTESSFAVLMQAKVEPLQNVNPQISARCTGLAKSLRISSLVRKSIRYTIPARMSMNKEHEQMNRH
jgi:hypothetical protein